jgi:hypothetical protein
MKMKALRHGLAVLMVTGMLFSMSSGQRAKQKARARKPNQAHLNMTTEQWDLVWQTFQLGRKTIQQVRLVGFDKYFMGELGPAQALDD